MQNRRSLGTEKEKLAVRYLEEQGATVLAKNFYFRGGELDLIIKDGEYVCFVEVKYRKSMSFGTPEAAVTTAKQRKIIHGARLFLYQNHYGSDTPCRFDVISVYQEEITWIKNAFELNTW
ncbi:MAG: YraN family protein [Lachnospiraceae bacterium]|nr:YraN family protein [Lachnospiraceae bacterium]